MLITHTLEEKLESEIMAPTGEQEMSNKRRSVATQMRIPIFCFRIFLESKEPSESMQTALIICPNERSVNAAPHASVMPDFRLIP